MSPYHTWEESECLQVLQDVAVLRGDEDHVEFLQRLVHIADTVCFHKGVLLARVHQFRKCSQETLNTRPGHFHKLPRYDGLAGLGAHRRCQQHLQAKRKPDCKIYTPFRTNTGKLIHINIRLTDSTFISTSFTFISTSFKFLLISGSLAVPEKMLNKTPANLISFQDKIVRWIWHKKPLG